MCATPSRQAAAPACMTASPASLVGPWCMRCATSAAGPSSNAARQGTPSTASKRGELMRSCQLSRRFSPAGHTNSSVAALLQCKQGVSAVALQSRAESAFSADNGRESVSVRVTNLICVLRSQGHAAHLPVSARSTALQGEAAARLQGPGPWLSTEPAGGAAKRRPLLLLQHSEDRSDWPAVREYLPSPARLDHSLRGADKHYSLPFTVPHKADNMVPDELGPQLPGSSPVQCTAELAMPA